MTTSRYLLAAALLAALAACKFGGTESHTGADAACVPVNAACSENSECCSYGCISGVCVANPVEGGTCRTTPDCAGGRLCKAGACTTGATCRDNGDVCSGWSQCCSGDCVSGACVQNHAPVAIAGPADVYDVPYTRTYQLQNESTDPDNDPMTYGWTVTGPDGQAVALTPGASARTPTFVPAVPGPYTAHLVVTDTDGITSRPYRLTSEAQVTIHVVNTAPDATATAPVDTFPNAPAGTWSRGQPITITGTASDRDGDTLQCAWRVTEPGATPTPLDQLTFGSCSPSTSFTPAWEGPYQVDLLVQDLWRGTATVHTTTTATATFTSRNDAPTPILSRSPYYGNLGATPDTTPGIALDASGSTDRNGDDPLSFAWAIINWPGYPDVQRRPALQGDTTATPSFVPNAEGDYVLQLTVTDPTQFGRAAASADPVQVTASVNRYVQELPHVVLAAARASTANKIVLAGRDPADATKGMLWTYDLSNSTESATGIRLVDPVDGTSALPSKLEVTPDASKAVVVDQNGSIWIVNLGATPAMSRVVQPFQVSELVVATSKFAYLFASGGGAYMRELDLTTGAYPEVGGYAGFGAVGRSGTTDLVYRVDTSLNGSWYRHTISGGGLQSSTVSASAPVCGTARATAIWGTLNGSRVVSSCGTVYNGTTLADLGTPLGVSPRYVDSTASSGALLVTSQSGTSIARFGASLEPLGTEQLRWWAQDGYGRPLTALRAFFNADASKRFAVVQDAANPARYGIMVFP